MLSLDRTSVATVVGLLSLRLELLELALGCVLLCRHAGQLRPRAPRADNGAMGCHDRYGRACADVGTATSRRRPVRRHAGLSIAVVALFAALALPGSAFGVTCFLAGSELDVQMHEGERITLVREGTALVVRAIFAEPCAVVELGELESVRRHREPGYRDRRPQGRAARRG